ncbi:uncharacterized protein LOC126382138 [Pectinophora gossypiella]|uniref:uncharacterized protein LOC126382138 n=1 Tax=Pectinophora gossypiella TaxID=13191 RepID=UPI00214E55E6|nr:uncharacterized protein LOC126382138 [Pectinophora gossypiella]
MVIQDDNETPLEVSTMKSSRLEATKYIIVKNHIRELPINDHKDAMHSSTEEDALKTEKKAKKSAKKAKTIQKGIEVNSDEKDTIISESDLEELRTVYKQCKSVLNRIETKYGHLLNLDGGASSSRKHNLKQEHYEEECHCTANKKIIFGEDGEQLLKEPIFDIHICPKKLKQRHSDHQPPAHNQNLAIEYEEQNTTLPDDMKALSNILQDSDISISYRNKVIHKLKSLKFDHFNEIRFNRPALVEQLKSNPQTTEIFEFKGANLSSLPGYPDWK